MYTILSALSMQRSSSGRSSIVTRNLASLRCMRDPFKKMQWSDSGVRSRQKEYVNLGDIKNSYRCVHSTQMERSHSIIFMCSATCGLCWAPGDKKLGLFLGKLCVAFRKLISVYKVVGCRLFKPNRNLCLPWTFSRIMKRSMWIIKHTKIIIALLKSKI